MTSTDTSLDPSLDFAYPVTWFPGVSDPSLAETIVLHAGDTRQADFHLVPIPSIHMRIVTPPRVNNGPNTPPVPTFPIVQQISSRWGWAELCPDHDALRPAGPDRCGRADAGGVPGATGRAKSGGPRRPWSK